MNKVFEALERLAMPDELHIKECKRLGISLTQDYEIIKQALLELKTIKEAKPSEAIKAFYCILNNDYDSDERYKLAVSNIEQALLKAQEQEKALEIVFEKNVDIGLLKRSENWLDYYTRVKHKTGKDTELTEEQFELLKRWKECQKN